MHLGIFFTGGEILKTEKIKYKKIEIALEIEEIRQKDRIYWQNIINELKILNRSGKLLTIGSIPKWDGP